MSVPLERTWRQAVEVEGHLVSRDLLRALVAATEGRHAPIVQHCQGVIDEALYGGDDPPKLVALALEVWRQSSSRIRFAPGYRSLVVEGGPTIPLNARQAAICQVLHEDFLAGGSGLLREELLQRVVDEVGALSMDDEKGLVGRAFRGNPLWHTVLIGSRETGRHSRYSLDLSDAGIQKLLEAHRSLT